MKPGRISLPINPRLADLRTFARRLQAEPPLGLALVAMFGAGFLVSPEPVWALVFYLGVLPLTVRRLWRAGSFEWRNPGTLLAASLILWSAMSLSWGEDPGGGRTAKFLWEAICTLIFLVGMILAYEEDRGIVARIGTAVIAAGACDAAISLARSAWLLPDVRLVGLAETRQAILGASVMATGYVFALARAIETPRFRLLNSLAAALCLAFILSTQSRTPILAAIMATLVLTARCRRPWRALAIGGAAAVFCLGVVFLLAPRFARDYVAMAIARGGSYRFEIWDRTLSEVAQRPWVGHGLAANLLMPKFTFPHSLYLSMLFYSGIVGLVLFLALVLVLLVGLLRNPDLPDRIVLLALWVNGLVSGLTDLGQITRGPGPNWYILWLPITLTIAALAGASGSSFSRSSSENVALYSERP